MSYDENKITRVIAKNIRKAREARFKTQEHLAKVLNISHQQVQKYEEGKNRISPAKLYILALYFDIPVQEFYKLTGPEVKDAISTK